MDNNAPAYPRNYDADGHNGITKREYAAIAAMQGLLVNPKAEDGPARLAYWSVTYADALLAELAK